MPTLPLILAGPVVRAVAPEAIRVWVATSIDVDVRVDCWPVRTTAPDAWGEDKDAIVRGEWTRPTRYGGRLFVALLKALPPQSGSGTGPGLALVGYTLCFRKPQPDRQRGPKRRRADWEAPELPADLPADGVALDGDPGLLGTTAVDLAWTGAPGPTVCFANGHLDRVMHSQGSGAADGPDPLVVLDFAIDQALQGDARSSAIPHSLFLVGGQVRAEAPNDSALRLMATLGVSLLGLDQRVPDPLPQPLGAARRLRSVEARRTWIKERRVFPSGEPASLAFTFGEYAALHVLRWSPAVWERADSNSEGESAAASARAARRLLANVPSYMVLSDLDVARGWNDTSDWRDLLGEKPSPRSPWAGQARPGRRVVANGLAAWWAFQGRGNDPEDTGADEIAEAVERFLKSADIDPFGSNGARWEVRWLGDRARWWGARTRTDPPAALLDTRTGRRPAAASIQRRTVGPAFLAGVADERLTAVLKSTKGTQDEVTFVASPEPLFDPVGWDLVQQRLAEEVASAVASGKPSDAARVREKVAGMAPGWAWNLPQVLRLLALLRDLRVRPILLTGPDGGAGASAAEWYESGATLDVLELRAGPSPDGGSARGGPAPGDPAAQWVSVAEPEGEHSRRRDRAVGLRLLPETVVRSLQAVGLRTRAVDLTLRHDVISPDLVGWRTVLECSTAFGVLPPASRDPSPRADIRSRGWSSPLIARESGASRSSKYELFEGRFNSTEVAFRRLTVVNEAVRSELHSPGTGERQVAKEPHDPRVAARAVLLLRVTLLGSWLLRRLDEALDPGKSISVEFAQFIPAGAREASGRFYPGAPNGSVGDADSGVAVLGGSFYDARDRCEQVASEEDEPKGPLVMMPPPGLGAVPGEFDVAWTLFHELVHVLWKFSELPGTGHGDARLGMSWQFKTLMRDFAAELEQVGVDALHWLIDTKRVTRVRDADLPDWDPNNAVARELRRRLEGPLE